MATAAFDTLKAAKQLKQSGFSEEQAETLSEVFRQSQESHLETLVTKTDLAEIKGDLAKGKAELEADVSAVRSDLSERITKVEGRLNLVQWMLGFNLALSVAVLWLLIRSAGLA